MEFTDVSAGGIGGVQSPKSKGQLGAAVTAVTAFGSQTKFRKR